MLAPPLAAASSDIHPPCLSAFGQPMEKALVFPNEFPYEFAFTSPEDLTETENETNEEEDENDFLAGLTRRLALFTQRLPSPPPVDNAEVNSTESTRSGLGSCTASGNKSPDGPFSQTLSPPETPVCEKDSVKVGDVAKIKVANFDAKPKSRPNPKPNSFVPFPQNAAFYNYNYYYYYYYYYWLRQTQPALFAYPPYPVSGVFAAPTAVKQPCAGTGVFTGPTAVKQPSVGTGVFLPRNSTNPSGSRKKAGKCVKSPTKVVQTQHSKTEKLPGRSQSSSQGRLSAGGSKLDRGTKSEVTGGSLKEEIHLPQEWMY
ncbi:uncharacterized protein LOC108851658 [Raphanus sativus]|uniref:Uncharacterized protein LOC108851658 n=1 Tax=Raphanus sativus TaxID=3726 RepID=A0A6J0N9V1_RAPSA|nr:uncharacterized protein LOC108851658 [Raphanus sativus]